MTGLIASLALAFQTAGLPPEDQMPSRPVPPIVDCWPGPWVVFFDRDRATLTAETKEIVGHILDTQRGPCGGFGFLLRGHIDGGEHRAVARRRALSLQAYLLKHRVGPDKMRIEDVGSREPRLPIISEVAELQNQRVEIQVRYYSNP